MASQGTRSLDGWLQRLAKTLSGGREMWQRRWFVLQGDTLTFFNAPDDVGGPPKWSIDLSNGSAASVGAEPTRIELYVGSEHIALKADSEVEAEMWVSALATEMAAPAPQPAAPAGIPASGPSAFSFMSAAPAEPVLPAVSTPPVPSPAVQAAGAPGSGAPSSGVKKRVRKAKLPGSQDFDPDAPAPAAAAPAAPPPPPAAPPPPPAPVCNSYRNGLTDGPYIRIFFQKWTD